MTDLKHSELTNQIIKIYYQVYNALGPGFLESVYQNAMYISLRKHNLNVAAKHKIDVHFEGHVVGTFEADIIVENQIILEIKAISTLVAAHESQLLNYLKSTGIEVGLLLNFGSEEPEFSRKVLSNDRKGNLSEQVKLD